MPQVIGDIFGLNTVYDKQVENVANRNFASWPESATYGYFGGGATPGLISTISRLDLSNESVSNPGNNLPSARGFLAGTSSRSYGYFGGGSFTPPLQFFSTISRLDFSNETVSDPGNNLPSARGFLAAVSSSSYGYFGGGYFTPPATFISTISRLDFSNETVSDPGNNLPTARNSLAATSSNSYGYFGGGFDGTNRFSTISRLDFSNETNSLPGNNLPSERNALAETSSSSYGYFGGGFDGTNRFSTISRLDFSNETVSNPGNNLPSERNALAETSSSSYGYFGGGSIPNAPVPTVINTISRLDFSNETVSNPGKNLPSARGNLAALSGGASVLRGNKTYGYTLGGKSAPGPTRRNEVDRMDFSTDTSTSTTPLPRTDERTAGAAGRTFGYVVNGESGGIGQAGQIYRMDFSNETQIELPQRLTYTAWDNAATSSHSYVYSIGGSSKSSISRIDIDTEVTRAITPLPGLPSGISGAAAISSSSYGYVGGGSIPTATSNIWRLDFSNETIRQPGAKVLVARDFMLSFANPVYGYFAGGSPIVSTVSRLDFSNETVSNPGNNLPAARGVAQGYSSSSYGYVGGGNIPGDTATIIKLDYSTDQTQLLSATLSVARNWVAGYSNSN
jgi:hypothetical protein